MNDPEFSIVGIGASAGGIDAFRTFFSHMPADSGLAFVLILHLPAGRKSMLPEIVGRWTSMPVTEAADDTLIEPNRVYVPPPHAVVSLADKRLRISVPTPEDAKVFRPIDAFFDALAQAMQDRAVGIVLSGTGTDGALGLKAIKERGGLTIAQGSDGTTPQYAEMPAGAIATGSVDVIASAEEMPGHLMRMRSGRLSMPAIPGQVDPQVDAARLGICALLRAQLGHDFSGYRDKTFLRRVQRRMQVVNVATLDEYLACLEKDHNEVVLLSRDLLIRVTSFFRDKETFETLETLVIPRLFEGKAADNSVRVWVPGCATGEEAYSLAMLLREHMDTLVGPPKVQVFATDLDDVSISTARLGRYPATLLEGLEPTRRERFFRPSHNGFTVTKDIRDLCTFSAHSLIRDPPFSRMNMVSCRNLLIYLDVKLQASVIPAFHYSLVPGGVLLLGGSESVARHADLFVPLDKAARIFQRRDVKSPPLDIQARTLDIHVKGAHKWEPPSAERRSGSDAISYPSRDARAAASARHWPMQKGRSEMVDSNISEQTRPLRARLGAAWQALFSGSEQAPRLEAELLGTQEQLQSLREEHQTALEELRSSNEELHSVNEEMQSTNEELETSKEELQSVNEELNTVNSRLSEKVTELDEANSDLRNLFESTEIATIFLDRHLIIRSFTPAISRLYNLIPSDVGRPLTDIISRLDYHSVRQDVARSLATLEPFESRVTTADKSAHYIMRILPYREPDSTVSGVLVTFVDVTSIVQAEAALVEADLRKDVFLATLSHELRNPLAPIRTAAHILQTPGLQTDQVARVQSIISRQVAHMSTLLDDLLDVSRITRGDLALKKERVDVKTVIDAAVEEAQSLIDSKRHTLVLQVPADALFVSVDPVRITQVLSNLLTNAAKYTPADGEITLSCSSDIHGLTISIRDNGIGLSREMIAQVFNMFTRVDSEEGAESGLGIGLALAKGLVELHGGKIEARSAALGKGSEFIVSLPGTLLVERRTLTRDAMKAAAQVPVARRVLIADDNLDGAETLQVFLDMLGHEVHVANSGEEALRLASLHRPDFAVLDIGMPELNGYEVARRLRQEAWGGAIRLIALTGWGQEGDKRRAIEAGFDHHMTKPVDPEQLATLLL